MNVSKYRKPHWLKKENCDQLIKLIITAAEERGYPNSDPDAETKVVLDLENEVGDKFRFSLNASNLEAIAKQFGDETDGWIDQEIWLRHDPTIEYKGEVRGGIRVIPAAEVPGNPATQSAGPPAKPVTKLVKKQAPMPARVGIQVDSDGETIPF
jgi:hypothetical protein